MMLFLTRSLVFLLLLLLNVNANASIFAPANQSTTVISQPYSYSSYSNKGYVKSMIPDIIYAEPYIYVSYVLSNLDYGSSKSHAPLANTMPLGFGGTLGLYLQDFMFLEFGMSGANSPISSAANLGISGGRTILLNNNLSLGARVPLTNDYQIGLLLLGGVSFAMLSPDYSSSSNAISSNLPGTQFFVMPHFGGGLEYRLNQRVALRTDVKFALTGTSKLVNSMITWSSGILIKF
jgi:hypothetical protein